MTALYNEYLTGAKREMATIIAESDAQFAKLNVLFEAVNATLEANLLAAEAKVYAENGTYDDLTMLYTEAEQEAAQKSKNIFSVILDGIISLITKIKNFFTGKFSNDVVAKAQELPEEVTIKKSTWGLAGLIEKGWGYLKDSVNKIKTGNYDGIGDVAKTWAPIATAVAALGAGTATIVVKRDAITKRLMTIDGILKQVDEAFKNAGKKAKESTGELKAANTSETEATKVQKATTTLKAFINIIGDFFADAWSELPFKKEDIEAIKAKKGAEFDAKKKEKQRKKNDAKTAKAEEQRVAGSRDQAAAQEFNQDDVSESVSIFGLEIDEDTFIESEISDEVFDELTTLFEEI